jgi:hypothetical protein
MNKKKVYFHGEVSLVESELPLGATEVKNKDSFKVIGESEVHGNDHRVSVDKRTKFFTKDDILFMETLGTNVYCPNEVKHTSIDIPAGTWKIGHAQEVDHITEHINRVRD